MQEFSSCSWTFMVLYDDVNLQSQKDQYQDLLISLPPISYKEDLESSVLESCSMC